MYAEAYTYTNDTTMVDNGDINAELHSQQTEIMYLENDKLWALKTMSRLRKLDQNRLSEIKWNSCGQGIAVILLIM